MLSVVYIKATSTISLWSPTSPAQLYSQVRLQPVVEMDQRAACVQQVPIHSVSVTATGITTMMVTTVAIAQAGAPGDVSRPEAVNLLTFLLKLDLYFNMSECFFHLYLEFIVLLNSYLFIFFITKQLGNPFCHNLAGSYFSLSHLIVVVPDDYRFIKRSLKSLSTQIFDKLVGF